MKIEIIKGTIFVDGTCIYNMTEDAQDNLRKRVASHVRTHRPEAKVDLYCVVRGVVQCYGKCVGDDIVLKI